MSLIMDAQKAAQREKDLRAGGADPNKAPLFVQLKSKGAAGTNWIRIVLVSAGSGALVVVAWLFLKQGDGTPRALRTPGPSVASIAAPPAATSANRSTESAKAPVVTTSPAGKQVAPVAPRALSTPPARRPPVVAESRTPVTAPRVARENPVATSRPPGLTVAVDQPRGVEVARLMAVGVAAHRAGDAPAARTAYEQVLAIAPSEPDALNNIGVLYTGLREFDRAESFLRRALAAAPTNAGAWNNLGTVLRERGRSADAIAAFQRALSLDSRHAGARIGLAQQYLVIGSLPQARQLLDEVLREYPTSSEANYASGQVLERMGDREGAVRAYEAFVRSAPPAHSLYVEAVRRRIDALSSRAP